MGVYGGTRCGTFVVQKDSLTQNQRVCDRPFSHHWTLESEVICAFGSLSAYVCYPHFATVLFGRSAIRTHRCPFAKNGLYLPLANASALFCTDRVATTELGKSRANRTPISSFGDYCSTIELCSHIVEITDKR